MVYPLAGWPKPNRLTASKVKVRSFRADDFFRLCVLLSDAHDAPRTLRAPGRFGIARRQVAAPNRLTGSGQVRLCLGERNCDTGVSRPRTFSVPAQRRTWPDPVNLFGAATCG